MINFHENNENEQSQQGVHDATLVAHDGALRMFKKQDFNGRFALVTTNTII